MRSTIDLGNSFSPSRTVTERAFNENVAVLSMDASNDSRFAARESIILQAIRSVMCAPIASSTRVWGVLYVDTVTTKKTFEQEDLEFLLAMARQAGIAMENLFPPLPSEVILPMAGLAASRGSFRTSGVLCSSRSTVVMIRSPTVKRPSRYSWSPSAAASSPSRMTTRSSATGRRSSAHSSPAENTSTSASPAATCHH